MISSFQITNESSISIINSQSTNSSSSYLRLSKIVHDFKNPLQTIIILCNSLESSISTNSTRESYEIISNLTSLSNFLLLLIENINDFSKKIINQSQNQSQLSKFESKKILEVKEASLFDICKFCFQIFEIRQKSDVMKKNVRIRFSYDSLLPEKVVFNQTVNQLKLKQVLTNLLSNSYKNTYSGYVELSVKLVSRISNENDRNDENDYVKVRFQVIDTGIGISDDVRNRILLPFSLESQNGSGLGMSIIFEIIKGFESVLEINTICEDSNTDSYNDSYSEYNEYKGISGRRTGTVCSFEVLFLLKNQRKTNEINANNTNNINNQSKEVKISSQNHSQINKNTTSFDNSRLKSICSSTKTILKNDFLEFSSNEIDYNNENNNIDNNNDSDSDNSDNITNPISKSNEIQSNSKEKNRFYVIKEESDEYESVKTVDDTISESELDDFVESINKNYRKNTVKQGEFDKDKEVVIDFETDLTYNYNYNYLNDENQENRFEGKDYHIHNYISL